MPAAHYVLCHYDQVRAGGKQNGVGNWSVYITKQHRDRSATGCALVSLGAAAGRSDQHFKTAYEQQVRTYLDLIASLDDADARAEAMVTLSALVGAVLISRAVADRNFSDELLETVASQLKRRASGTPATRR